MSQELHTLDRARLADVVRASAVSTADSLAEFRRATELARVIAQHRYQPSGEAPSVQASR